MEKTTLTVIRVADIVSALQDSPTKGIPFMEFWDLYPIKVNKLKSSQKWLHLPEKDQRAILADLPLRKQTRQWLEGFIPHPTTYLNGRRWEDELEVSISNQTLRL